MLTGRRVSLDSIGRLVYAVRSVVREVTVFDYRGAVPDTGASTVFRLGDSPVSRPRRAAGAARRPAPARLGEHPHVAARAAQRASAAVAARNAVERRDALSTAEAGGGRS